MVFFVDVVTVVSICDIRCYYYCIIIIVVVAVAVVVVIFVAIVIIPSPISDKCSISVKTSG